jgi:hypothetical protein
MQEFIRTHDNAVRKEAELHGHLIGVDGELWQLMERQKQSTIGMPIAGKTKMFDELQLKLVDSKAISPLGRR